MLQKDDASVVSKPQEGPATTAVVIVSVFGVADLTMSAKRQNTTLLFRIPHHEPQQGPLVVEGSNQKYKQMEIIIYLGNTLDEDANINLEIESRLRFTLTFFQKYGRRLSDRPTRHRSLKSKCQSLRYWRLYFADA